MGVRPLERPALIPAVVFLTGLGLGSAGVAVVPGTPWIVAGLGAAALVVRRRSRAALALLLLGGLAFLGAGMADRDSASYQRRVRPFVEGPTDLHFTGRLLGLPETDAQGERLLRVRGVPLRGGQLPGEPLTLWLRVRRSPPEPTARVDALHTGDRVRVWCRVHASRQMPALRARGIDLVGTVKSARLVEALDDRGATRPRWIDRIKRAARSRLDRAFGENARGRAVAGAMLLGDQAALSAADWRVLRDAGLNHLVSISGLHVGLGVCGVQALLVLGGLASWLRAALILPLLAGFAVAVGAGAPVVRASLAAAVLVVGRSVGRSGDALNTLVLLAVVLVAIQPAVIAAPGFQLTFVATAGLVTLARPLGDLLPPPRSLARAIAVSLAAYLATAPVVAWHFGWLAPVGLLTNLLAVPLSGVLMAAGYVALLLPRSLPLIVALDERCCRAAADGILAIADAAAAWPPGAFPVARPTLGLAAAHYLLLALLLRVLTLAPRHPSRHATAALLGWLLVWMHLGPFPESGGRTPHATILDVGQGLAVVLGGSSGVMLVDTGGSRHPGFDPGERVVLPHLRQRGHRRLEAVVLTHGHLDHAGGAASLLRELDVGELWLGPGFRHSPLLGQLADLARSRGTAVRLAERGLRAAPGGVPIRVLAPDRRDARLDDNERSVVLVAGEAPSRILIPGDLERPGELELCATGLELRAEALVVGHHGSRHGSSTAWLREVRPSWAIVSVGRGNPFGHPHPETLERLRIAGAELLRTDELGPIELRGGPHGWTEVGPGVTRGDGSEPP